MIEQITCEFISSARGIDKAIVAELLANSRHKVLRCDKCGKFHKWTRAADLEWTGPTLVRREAKTEYYVQVGPNAYLHKGLRRKGSRKGKRGNSEEE